MLADFSTRLCMESAAGNELMHTIMETLAAGPVEQDLFGYWRKELELRRMLKDALDGPTVHIENQAQFDFLRRGLFYGPHQDSFFNVLWRNMAEPAVITMVMDSSPSVVVQYLDYLTIHMTDQHRPAPSLRFLINLYNEHWQPQYARLIQTLDAEQCGYLVSRTGNGDLRRMLKDRLEKIKDHAAHNEPMTGDKQPVTAWPSIHGDKVELLSAAATVLQGWDQAGAVPNQSLARVETLMDGAELLFRAGLLSDCMAVLNRMFSDRELERHSALLSATGPLGGRLLRLLDRVVPIFGLLVDPFHPRSHVLSNYRNLFPGCNPDPASLLYLDLYALVLAGLQKRRHYASFEIVQKASAIRSLCDDDRLVQQLVVWGHSGVFNGSGLLDFLGSKMMQRPHETLAGLETLRYLHMRGALSLDRPTASGMLSVFLQLFYWLPHPSFINSQLVKQIGPESDEEVRRESEQILVSWHRVWHDNKDTPAVPPHHQQSGAEQALDKMIRLSRSMGVL